MKIAVVQMLHKTERKATMRLEYRESTLLIFQMIEAT
jgi:hypothetical protein